jgi:hypothetical protein
MPRTATLWIGTVSTTTATATARPRGRFGARASNLYALLEKGHHDLCLSPEEMHRLDPLARLLLDVLWRLRKSARPGPVAWRARPADAGVERAAKSWSAAACVHSGGEHRTDAQYLGVRDGAVQLRRADGKEIAIPLPKLSPQDQAFVRLLQPDAANASSPPAR